MTQEVPTMSERREYGTPFFLPLVLEVCKMRLWPSHHFWPFRLGLAGRDAGARRINTAPRACRGVRRRLSVLNAPVHHARAKACNVDESFPYACNATQRVAVQLGPFLLLLFPDLDSPPCDSLQGDTITGFSE
jgi:hypothetical protein